MVDWSVLRTQLRLETVAEDVLGPPAARKGRRLLWCCPFHNDSSPSLEVDTRDQRWRCWPCRVGGDSAKLVQLAKHLTFPEALRWLADRFSPGSAEIHPPVSRTVTSLRQYDRDKAARKATKATSGPSGLDPANALALVEKAVERLWEPAGAADLDYLRARGLTDATIRAARLGSVGWTSVPTRAGDRWWRVRGITIPWFDAGRLVMLKIRRLNEDRQKDGYGKYAEAFRDGPRLYTNVERVLPRRENNTRCACG